MEQNNTTNKIADGLSKLFDKAEGMKKDNDGSGDVTMKSEESSFIRRPHTANPIKRASKFSKQSYVSTDDVSMESESEYSSSSDSEMEEEKKKDEEMEVAQNTPMGSKRNKKKGKWGNKNSHIEIVSSSCPTITPQMRKRSLLVSKKNSEENKTSKVQISLIF